MTYTEPLLLSDAKRDLAVGASVPPAPGRVRLLWNFLTGVVGAIVGVAPHVLHHIGFLDHDMNRPQALAITVAFAHDGPTPIAAGQGR